MSDLLKCFLRKNILDIYDDKKKLNLKLYMDIYSKVYKHCLDNTRIPFNTDKNINVRKLVFDQRKILYDYILEVIKEVCNKILVKVKKTNFLINSYNLEYNNFMICSKIFNKIFEYYNRLNLENENNKLLFIDECKNIFVEIVIRSIHGNLIYNIMEIVDNNRVNNNTFDFLTIKKVVKSFIETDIHEDLTNYDIFFKNSFINYSIDYYCKKFSYVNFFETVDRFIEYEMFICENYLNNSGSDLIETHKKMLIDCLIIKYFDNIEEYYYNALENKNINKIVEIYLFFKKYSNQDNLKLDKKSLIVTIFKKFCKNDIDKTIKEFVNEKKFMIVETFIDINNFYNSLINQMCNDINLMKIYTEIFLEKINLLEGKKHNISNYLCKYIDITFQKLNDNYELKLNNIIKLVYYLNDKDYFEIFYKKYLSKRLINNFKKKNNEVLDIEIYLLKQLKEVIDNGEIEKLKLMINDYKISETLYGEFENKKFNTLVITQAVWPNKHINKSNINSVVYKHLQGFEDFYKNKHNDRKLLWNKDLITGTITTNFLKKKYTFSLTHNMIDVVLKFNNCDVLEKKIFDNDYKSDINILLKSRLLLEDENNLILNKKYNNKKQKISLIISKDKTDNKSITTIVNVNRNEIIMASLVRIMKSRRTLSHNNLISECLEQISKFSPKVTDVKKNIEKLIEKEYIERNQDDMNFYNYLA